jgi:cadmium resistance protein CadD (predicted permease)
VSAKIGTMAAAAGIFAGTDVDDLVVLTVLFLTGRASGRPRAGQIWAGQYLGIAALVAVSGATALGLTLVPDRSIGLLGLIPLGIGVVGLVRAVRRGGAGEDRPPTAGGVLGVAGITIANGADNIAVYTPLFRALGPGGSAVTIAVFAVLVAVWCLTASWLGAHRRVIAVVERYGHWLVPVVFIGLGLVILVRL